jgi:spore maturation protein SpmA
LLNRIWSGFFLVAFAATFWQWFANDNQQIFSEVIKATFDMASLSVEIALGLIGILALWMGLLNIAEQGGLSAKLAWLLSPLLTRLMPEVPKNHPALGSVSMNMAANMMGLDNAATPIGLKAMEQLQSLNPKPDTATNAQIMFLVINTSSVTLFPITILMYRAQMGASDPSAVFLPILLATFSSTFVGLLAVAAIQRINLLDKVLLAWFAGLGLVVGSLVYSLLSLPAEQLTSVSSTLGNGLLVLAITCFFINGIYKKINLYESFIDGAKQGFELAIKIIPYLVAMLVAIGVLRASGVLGSVTGGIAKLFAAMGLNTAFVDALPTAIMNPLSGSGARAMMLETFDKFGVDSFAGKLSSVIQGSTETTFYVLTVYFGAVGIRKVRHAIGCGLLADLAGIVAAILLSYWFFAV